MSKHDLLLRTCAGLWETTTKQGGKVLVRYGVDFPQVLHTANANGAICVHITRHLGRREAAGTSGSTYLVPVATERPKKALLLGVKAAATEASAKTTNELAIGVATFMVLFWKSLVAAACFLWSTDSCSCCLFLYGVPVVVVYCCLS
jgi:hypothetical protein